MFPGQKIIGVLKFNQYSTVLNGGSEYSKTCLEQPLKNRQNKVLKTNGSLMKVESIAECSLEHSAILSPCIKR